MGAKYIIKAKDGATISPEKAREILSDGKIRGKKITDRQRRYFGAMSNRAEDGATIEQISDNPYSSPIIQFNGPNHDNGGIDIQYAGQRVEVEGQETGFVDQEGSLVVLGNLNVPGTKTKFKNVGKEIAKSEVKTAKQFDAGIKLINEADPYDPFERLKFNSGVAMSQGAQMKQKELSTVKEGIAALQNDMLQQANALGIKPEQLQKGKAKFGIKLAQTGGTYGDPPTRKLSLAQRNNNPGNLKYAAWMKKYGAVPGQAGTDGGNFAVFPTLQQGQQAMTALLKDKSYQSRTVMDAITRWTGGAPYNIIPDNLKGKKVSDLNQQEFNTLRNVITQGEDSKLYNWEGIDNPTPLPPNAPPGINLPQVEIIGRRTRPDITPNMNFGPDPTIDPMAPLPPNVELITPPDTPVPSTTTTMETTRGYRNPLRFGQIAPEILTIATERAQFVPGQRFDPNLYQPYQVSFQDRLNENQSTFNAISRQLGGNRNAAALSALAAQKYQADSQVLADEFRTNQSITNDITNKNIALLNQAQLTNIELNDQQFVRQEQARANTRQNIRAAVQSISDKIQSNAQQNMSYNFARQIVAPQFGITPRSGDVTLIPNEGLQFGQSTPSSTITQTTTRRK